jgi:hypothetical protein
MANEKYTLECIMCNTRKNFKSFKAFERGFWKEMGKHPSATAKALSFNHHLKITAIAIL